MEEVKKGYPDPEDGGWDLEDLWDNAINLHFVYEGTEYYLSTDSIGINHNCAGVYLDADYYANGNDAHRIAKCETSEEYQNLILFGKPFKEIIAESTDVYIVM